MAKKKKFEEEVDTKTIDIESLEEVVAEEVVEEVEPVIEEKPKKKSSKGKKLTLKTSVSAPSPKGHMRLIMAGTEIESGVDVTDAAFKRLAEKHS